MRKGTRLKAVDSLGSTRALFEIRDNFDGAMTLDPVYIDYPLPGMAIEDSGEWKMTGTIASGFRFSSPEVFVQFSLGRTDLIYPFVPLVSLAYRYGEGGSYVYGGVGLEAYFCFFHSCRRRKDWRKCFRSPWWRKHRIRLAFRILNFL